MSENEVKTLMTTVAQEVSSVVSQVNAEKAVSFVQLIKEAERLFISGEGRSGLIGKTFAMRLMHAGFQVYVIGETITPSIGKGDLLIVISGSGQSPSLYETVQKAKSVGAKSALVTSNPMANLGELSDALLTIPAATKQRKEDEPLTIQPLGNQFDQSAHLVLDALIIYALQDEQGAKDVYQQMLARHANME